MHNVLLDGIIKALVGFPKGEKRARRLQAMIQLQQDDGLKELLVQASKTLTNLHGCDTHLKQNRSFELQGIHKKISSLKPFTTGCRHSLEKDKITPALQHWRP